MKRFFEVTIRGNARNEYKVGLEALYERDAVEKVREHLSRLGCGTVVVVGEV